MDKSKIMIIAIIAVFIVAIVVIINSSSNNKTEITTQNETTLDMKTEKTVEETLKKALEECKTMYAIYNYENFNIYFDPNFMNEYFEEGTISLETNVENKNYSTVEIYDFVGNRLEAFPEIVYEKDNFNIEPNKTYLLRVYTTNNNYTYYYKVKIDVAGNASLEEVCYTIGEINIYNKYAPENFNN